MGLLGLNTDASAEVSESCIFSNGLNGMYPMVPKKKSDRYVSL